MPGVVVASVNTIVRTHQVEHLRYMRFIVCKSQIDKNIYEIEFTLCSEKYEDI